MTREHDCARFLGRLEAYLAGALDRPEQARCDVHVRECPDCAETVVLLRDRSAPEPPEGLTESVLRRTTGDACTHARARLGEDVEDAPARGHAASCAACGPLVRTIDRLERDLPRIAEADPGPAFAAAVLARTTNAPTARFRRRLAEAWSALVRRPRFAFEFSYAVVVVAVVGFAIGNVRPSGVMPRAIRTGAAVGTEAAGRAGTDLGAWIRDGGRDLGRALTDAFDFDTDDDAEDGFDRPAGGHDDERN